MKLLAQPVVEWLGTTPSDWSQPRLKGVFRDSTSSISIEQLAELEVQHYSIPNFDEFGAPACENGATIASNKTLLRGGEILFSKLNCHKPRVWLVPHDDQVKVASTEFIPLAEWHSGKTDKRFVTYLVGSAVFAEYMTCFQTSVTNSHRRINPNDLWQTRVPLPPLPVQQRITAYLDASCAAIDAAVAAKRCQLETLEALRLAVIQDSVTKGLDPKVAMASGIDWLPQVPKHWGMAKLKRHTQMIRGQFSHRPRNDPAFYDGPYPFIQTGSISAADKYITEFTQTLNEEGLRTSRLFPADTVVMTITGAKIAEVAVTTFEACFPDSIVGFVPGHRLVRDFLYYLLIAMKPTLLRAMVVTTQTNINYVQIGGNYIPLPPVPEQELIVNHIEQRLQDIGKIRSSLESQIDTLASYRKSLIHECVTGQRRITEADVRAIQTRTAKLTQEPTLPQTPE
jgi:type I restriction enzyme S subunit